MVYCLNVASVNYAPELVCIGQKNRNFECLNEVPSKKDHYSLGGGSWETLITWIIKQP